MKMICYPNFVSSPFRNCLQCKHWKTLTLPRVLRESLSYELSEWWLIGPGHLDTRKLNSSNRLALLPLPYFVIRKNYYTTDTLFFVIHRDIRQYRFTSLTGKSRVIIARSIKAVVIASLILKFQFLWILTLHWTIWKMSLKRSFGTENRLEARYKSHSGT